MDWRMVGSISADQLIKSALPVNKPWLCLLGYILVSVGYITQPKLESLNEKESRKMNEKSCTSQALKLQRVLFSFRWKKLRENNGALYFAFLSKQFKGVCINQLICPDKQAV